jgi:hypothetical protein
MRGGSGIVCFYSMSGQDVDWRAPTTPVAFRPPVDKITHQDRQLNLPLTKKRLSLDDEKFWLLD